MIVSKIIFNNFKIYKGTNHLVFSPSGDKNIAIVSGRNGYGKTSFLVGLVWCLYGNGMKDIDDIYKQEILGGGGYKPYLLKSLNRAAEKNKETKFSVSITFREVELPSVNCSSIEIIRSYDTSSDKEELTILLDGVENELTEESEKEKNNFIQDFILPKEVAKFFLFDAEKVVAIASTLTQAETRAMLSRAYSEVLGIKKYQDLKDNLEKEISKIAKESANSDDKKKLNTLITDIQNYEEDINSNKEELLSIEENKANLNFEIDQIQTKLIRTSDAISPEEIERIRNEKLLLEQKQNKLKEGLKELYEIVPFAIAADKLSIVFSQICKELEVRLNNEKYELDKKKVDAIIDEYSEETHITEIENDRVTYKIRNFFTEKLKDLLVKHFDLRERTQIKDVESFRFLHNFTTTEQNELNELLISLKTTYKKKFEQISKEYKKTKDEFAIINRKLSDAESKAEDPWTVELRKEKEHKEQLRESASRKIFEIEAKIERIQSQIQQKKKDKNSIEAKIKTSESFRSKRDLIQRLIKIVNTFTQEFKELKKRSLEEKILSWTQKLFHKQEFIHNVRIHILPSNDEFDIELLSADEELISIGEFSMGERQLFTTAILQALIEEATIQFPVFIDSPMQKLDKEHARNVLEHFYPNSAKQVVIFPLLETELSEQDFEIIKSYVSNAYLIRNIDKDSSTFLEIEGADLFEEHNNLKTIN